MCANYVYKRRRLQNTFALLTAPKEAQVCYVLDCYNPGIGSKLHPLTILEGQNNSQRESPHAFLDGDAHKKHCLSEGLDLHIDGGTPPNHTTKLEAVERLYKQKEKEASESYGNNHHNVTSDHNYSVNDSCSSSRSQLEQYSTSRKVEVDDMGECSSSDVIVLEQPSEFSSSRDLCVHVLKANRLSEHSSKTASGTLFSCNVLGWDDANFCLPCKICGHMGNPRNMLICDLCEEAFHLHCCHAKGPFREEWYCQPCFSKNPRPLLDAAMGKSFRSISEEYKRRILQKELGPIQFMLKDTQPYTSGVQVGKAFQADVPEWSTPTIEDNDSFGDPLPPNPAESYGPSISKSSRLSSIGNWVQCREVIYNNMDKYNSGIICGKWRRAPLFVSQTDNWDCSCSVVWDPIHADCAVPQELETEEVLKQLKFVEMLRARLDKKQACGQTKTDAHR